MPIQYGFVFCVVLFVRKKSLYVIVTAQVTVTSHIEKKTHKLI